MRFAYFITHPDVIKDPKAPVPRWTLSQRGQERMKQLLGQPWVERIEAVYCSTEQKAIDGAQILAGHLGIEYEMVEDLGEIDRSATGYLSLDELRPVVEQFFAQPDQSIRGWETASHAQRRIADAIEAVIMNDRHKGDMAIVSHGTVGTLYLCLLKACPISIEERQPGSNGGNYFCFEALTKTLKHGWTPIDG